MSEQPTILTNSAGVPFDVCYGGNDHAIVIGKIAQGKSFCTETIGRQLDVKTEIDFAGNNCLIVGANKSRTPLKFVEFSRTKNCAVIVYTACGYISAKISGGLTIRSTSWGKEILLSSESGFEISLNAHYLESVVEWLTNHNVAVLDERKL